MALLFGQAGRRPVHRDGHGRHVLSRVVCGGRSLTDGADVGESAGYQRPSMSLKRTRAA